MNEQEQNKDSEQKTVRGIPFKDFLDKSANIIVILGIFNALLIYSTTHAAARVPRVAFMHQPLARQAGSLMIAYTRRSRAKADLSSRHYYN